MQGISAIEELITVRTAGAAAALVGSACMTGAWGGSSLIAWSTRASHRVKLHSIPRTYIPADESPRHSTSAD